MLENCAKFLVFPQFDSHNPAGPPRNDLCTCRLHFWCWNVWDGAGEGGQPLRCWNLRRWWLQNPIRPGAEASLPSGPVLCQHHKEIQGILLIYFLHTTQSAVLHTVVTVMVLILSPVVSHCWHYDVKLWVYLILVVIEFDIVVVLNYSALFCNLFHHR